MRVTIMRCLVAGALLFSVPAAAEILYERNLPYLEKLLYEMTST